MSNVQHFQAKKIYLAEVAFISVVALLMSTVFLVTGVVNLVNPSEIAYPRTLVEYKERYAIFDEKGMRAESYQYTEEEMRMMWEEERAMESEARKRRYINQIVVSGAVGMLSGWLWASHWKKLRED